MKTDKFYNFFDSYFHYLVVLDQKDIKFVSTIMLSETLCTRKI